MKTIAKSMRLVILGGLITMGTLPAYAESANLEAIIDEGLSNNQSIRSEAAELDALRSRIPAAGALPDPRIGIGILNLPTDTFSTQQEPMTQKQIALEQQIPWLSKLDLETRMAVLAAREQAVLLEDMKISLARQIADAWYQLGQVAYQQDITDRLVEMVRRIRRDMESRYAVGRGLQQDIFQAEVELSRLLEKQIMLENQRRTVEERLNAMLNRSRFEAVTPPGDAFYPEKNLDADALTQTALAENPNVLAQRIRIARAETAVELAKKEYYPDFNVRLAYGQRDENEAGQELADFFSATVSFDIPLWKGRKQDNLVSAALAERQAAENAHENLVRRLPFEVNALVTEIRDLKSRYKVYENKLIPQAGQWARSALDAYEVGELEFDTMIDTRIRELQIEQQAEILLYRLMQKQAELAELTGKRIIE